MTLVAIVAGKHAPGATTLSLALAAVAPTDVRPLVVEADPAGGDIAPRAGLAFDPGLVTLAAAVRRGGRPELLHRHEQQLPNEVRALVGPSSPEQATTALTSSADALAELLRAEALAIVDVGRWYATSPAAAFVRESDIVIVALRATLEGIEHARTRLETIPHSTPRIAVVVGDAQYPLADVRAALDLDDAFMVPRDPRAAASLATGMPLDRWTRRSAYLRAVNALTERVVARPAETVMS